MGAMPDSRTPTLDAQAGSRRGILMALKKRGRARAEELAEVLGITASAVRQHLTGLLGYTPNGGVEPSDFLVTAAIAGLALWWGTRAYQRAMA